MEPVCLWHRSANNF